MAPRNSSALYRHPSLTLIPKRDCSRKGVKACLIVFFRGGVDADRRRERWEMARPTPRKSHYLSDLYTADHLVYHLLL